MINCAPWFTAVRLESFPRAGLHPRAVCYKSKAASCVLCRMGLAVLTAVLAVLASAGAATKCVLNLS